MRMPNVLLTLAVLVAVPICCISQDISDYVVRPEEPNDASSKLPATGAATKVSFDGYPRDLDFEIQGLYSANGTLYYTGLYARRLGFFFTLVVYHHGSTLSVNKKLESDFDDRYTLTVHLYDGQLLDMLAGMLFIMHSWPDTRHDKCCLNMTLGPQDCRFNTSHFLRLKIVERVELSGCQEETRLSKGDEPVRTAQPSSLHVPAERVQLSGCRQSSIKDSRQPDNCERAYAIVSGIRTGLASCSLTRRELKPWWRAVAPATFQFDTFDIYAAPDLNAWTRDFEILVEQAVCVSARDGEQFIKKSFACGLYGTAVTVRATGDNDNIF